MKPENPPRAPGSVFILGTSSVEIFYDSASGTIGSALRPAAPGTRPGRTDSRTDIGTKEPRSSR